MKHKPWLWLLAVPLLVLGLASQRVIDPEAEPPPAEGPSMLYRRGFWRLGLFAARCLPERVCTGLMTSLTRLYSRLAPGRRRIVTENILPVLNGDEKRARAMSGKLFRQFGVKLVDLWRFETGQSPDSLLTDESGWEHFMAARASGRGILIVTPHLGNWEFGGPLLIRRGVPLHVVTQVEPGNGFTELRKDARARWGIETHVIGDKPFAVVEVIKLLERGAVIALLMDRPPASTAVTVELFGRPFHASVAAAELARASGCAVLPVALPRSADGYAAHIFPEVPYERSALNKREARIDFTQAIVRTFEPVIHKHLDQWYHFVPVWPRYIAVGIATTSASTNLTEWLDAQAKIQSWSADFVQTRTLKALVQPLKSEGHIWFAAPNRFRWELGQPPQTIAARTTNALVLVYPKLKRVERYPLSGSEAGSWRDMLALLEAGFPRSKTELEGQFRVMSVAERAGKCQVALQPKSTQARRWIGEIEIEFDVHNFSLAATELRFADGSILRNDFVKPALNVPVDETLFSPKIEPNYTVVEPLKKPGRQ